MKPVKHYVSNPYYALLSMVAYTHNLSGIWIQLATTWRYSTVGNIYAPNNASQKIKSHALLLLPHNDSTVINRHCNSSHTEHSLHNFNMCCYTMVMIRAALSELICGFSLFHTRGIYTVSSRKYAPPFCTLHLYKSGEGAFAWIFSSSHAYAPSLHSS